MKKGDISMISRRNFSLSCSVAAVVPILVSPALADSDENICAAFTPELQKATTPDHAIALLKAGNDRFAAGKSTECDLLGSLKATAGKQSPFACVLGCIDSRAAPELVFDQQIGDIFSARVAGNIVDVNNLGSFEFATKVAGAKAIVVLGHTSCGAVKGAVDNVRIADNLTSLLSTIMPAVEETPLQGERSSKNHQFVENVAEANVRRNVKALTERSTVLKELVDSGALKIVGAMFDLHTGKVTMLA